MIVTAGGDVNRNNCECVDRSMATTKKKVKVNASVASNDYSSNGEMVFMATRKQSFRDTFSGGNGKIGGENVIDFNEAMNAVVYGE